MNVRKMALRAARLGWVGGGISFVFRHFSGVLPINKVYENADVIAFFHPVPSCDPHILIIPKARMRTAFDFTDDRLRAVLCAGEAVAKRYEMPLQMRINGGCRQEVMQAHFHLTPASAVRGLQCVTTMEQACTLAHGAMGFSFVFLMGKDGIWVDRTRTE